MVKAAIVDDLWRVIVVILKKCQSNESNNRTSETERLYLHGYQGFSWYSFVLIGMFGYTGATFMANGGIPKLTSVVGNTSIYAKEFHIVRHHKGRP